MQNLENWHQNKGIHLMTRWRGKPTPEIPSLTLKKWGAQPWKNHSRAQDGIRGLMKEDGSRNISWWGRIINESKALLVKKLKFLRYIAMRNSLWQSNSSCMWPWLVEVPPGGDDLIISLVTRSKMPARYEIIQQDDSACKVGMGPAVREWSDDIPEEPKESVWVSPLRTWAAVSGQCNESKEGSWCAKGIGVEIADVPESLEGHGNWMAAINREIKREWTG